MGKKHGPARRAERSSGSGGDDRPSPPAKVGRAAAGKSKFAHDYSKDYSDPNWPYAKGKMDKSAWLVIILTPTIVISALMYYRYLDYMKELVRTPLDVPKVIGSSATSALEDPERFWGTYRSGAYFGMKTRSPRSPVTGLMWMTQFDGEMPPAIRHW